VLGVFGLGLRDLATRIVPPETPALLLSTYAFGALIPTGAAMMAVMGTPWVMPTAAAWGWMACANAVGVLSYVAIVTASRTGDVSVVAPFRYIRLVFALGVGVTVFGERPDALTLIGAAVIVGSGLYTLVRQARRKQSSSASLTDTTGL
jgi:drug/metabolite transporter (DMT)-like permease